MSSPAPRKPKALRPGSTIAPFSPASPAEAERIAAGKRELERLGFRVPERRAMSPEGYFAGSALERRLELLASLEDAAVDALIAVRGGYGSAYLLEEPLPDLARVKPIVGFSDLSTLEIFLWQNLRWVTFYGPMFAAGLDSGCDAPGGYDSESFRNALMKTARGWSADLRGEILCPGSAEGILVGGALTLVEATLGTGWELDTRGALLLLEDRAMKPYQVDRVLLHLKQAGKLEAVRGIVLGDFPECQAPGPGSPGVRDVALRILGPLEIPVVFGAPVGHTARPMLTLPLGVPARLLAEGSGTLEFPEPSVNP
jgi:muramoyltetrapeptide carboxypeptidase